MAKEQPTYASQIKKNRNVTLETESDLIQFLKIISK